MKIEDFEYIKDFRSEDTGGGFVCDVLTLEDGTVLVISEEAIVLYSSLEAWEDNNHQLIIDEIIRVNKGK